MPNLETVKRIVLNTVARIKNRQCAAPQISEENYVHSLQVSVADLLEGIKTQKAAALLADAIYAAYQAGRSCKV